MSGEKLKQLVAGKTHWHNVPGARHSREKQTNMPPIYVLAGLWSQISTDSGAMEQERMGLELFGA